MTPKDWTLMVIAAAQGEPVSPVQLQRALLLVATTVHPSNRKTDRFYQFVAWDGRIWDDAIFFDTAALIGDSQVGVHQTRGLHRRFFATPDGLVRAAHLRETLEPSVVEYVEKVVRLVVNFPTTAASPYPHWSSNGGPAR